MDKIRKIRRDGTPDIQEDVREDRLTINKAYDLIRKMELGEEDEKNSRKLSAAQIKVLKSVLTEENLAALEDLDGDIPALLKKAVEEFLARAGREGGELRRVYLLENGEDTKDPERRHPSDPGGL